MKKYKSSKKINVLNDLTTSNENRLGAIADEEKPKEPKSNLAVPPFYIYRKDTLEFFDKYIDEGNNPDAPGNFIPWLIKHKDVYAFKFKGMRYDIGTPESYERVKGLFGSQNNALDT